MTAYRAFLSYSHGDTALARRLHKRLEEIQAPRQTNDLPKRPCAPIFRDRDELGEAASLTPSIEAALADSDMLIVLATPRSSQSRWVDREISFFSAQCPQRPIVAIAAHGEEPEGACFSDVLRGLVSTGRAKVISLDAEGIAETVARCAARIMGVDATLLERSERSRRARGLGLLAIVNAAAAVIVACALWYVIASAVNWSNSVRAAYAAMNELYLDTRDVAMVGEQAGPTTALSVQVYEDHERRIEALARDLPALAFLPGGRYLLDLLSCGIHTERARLLLLLGRTDEALRLALEARTLANRMIAPRPGRFLYELSSDFIFGAKNNAALTRTKIDKQTWYVLSTAEGAAYQERTALTSATHAFDLAVAILRNGGGRSEDWADAMMVGANKAAAAAAFDAGPITWRTATAEVIALAKSMPQRPGADGVNWALMRATWLTQFYVGRANDAARWGDKAEAQSAARAAEQWLTTLRQLAPNPALPSLNDELLNYARSVIAADANDWRNIERHALADREGLVQVEYNAADYDGIDVYETNNDMFIAIARSHFGGDYAPPMREAVSRARARLAKDAENAERQAQLADALVDVTDIETRVGACGQANAARAEAIELYQSVAAHAAMGAWRRLRLRDLDQIPRCAG